MKFSFIRKGSGSNLSPVDSWPLTTRHSPHADPDRLEVKRSKFKGLRQKNWHEKWGGTCPAALLPIGVLYMYHVITFGRVVSKAFLLLKPAKFTGIAWVLIRLVVYKTPFRTIVCSSCKDYMHTVPISWMVCSHECLECVTGHLVGFCVGSFKLWLDYISAACRHTMAIWSDWLSKHE